MPNFLGSEREYHGDTAFLLRYINLLNILFLSQFTLLNPTYVLEFIYKSGGKKAWIFPHSTVVNHRANFSFYFYLKCMASKDNLCCTDDLDFGRPNMGAPCQSFDVLFKQDKVMRAWNRVPLNKFFFFFVCYVVSFGPGYPFSFIIMLWMDYKATYTLLRVFFSAAAVEISSATQFVNYAWMKGNIIHANLPYFLN